MTYPSKRFILAAALCAATSLWAQNAPATQPESQPDAQQAAGSPQQQTMTSLPPQGPQSRAQVLRNAQARVRARRRLRDRQIIQDTYSHKYEVYFGGGYLRFRPGNSLQHISEASWNVGLTDWVKDKWGVTVDARGYYGTTFIGPNAYNQFKPSISQYSLMAGPSYHFFEGVHWGWSAQLLAGVGRGNFDTGTGGLPGKYLGLYPNGNALNLSAGAAVDYNLSPALTLRLMPMALITDYGSTLNRNLGFNAGVAYRWGRK